MSSMSTAYLAALDRRLGEMRPWIFGSRYCVADALLAAAVELRIGCKLSARGAVEADPSELVPLINRHIRPLATPHLSGVANLGSIHIFVFEQ